MSPLSSRMCGITAVLIASLLILPSDAAIGRPSSGLFGQLFRKDEARQGRLDWSDKSSESSEFYKPKSSPIIIEENPADPKSAAEPEILPKPLPSVFDEDLLAFSGPGRLDVLKEAGSELPWPIGSYNAHFGSGARISGFAVPPARQRLGLSSVPVFDDFDNLDRRHHYMHTILHGYGKDDEGSSSFEV